MGIEYFWYKIQLHNYVVGYSYFKHNLIFGWNILMVSFLRVCALSMGPFLCKRSKKWEDSTHWEVEARSSCLGLTIFSFPTPVSIWGYINHMWCDYGLLSTRHKMVIKFGHEIHAMPTLHIFPHLSGAKCICFFISLVDGLLTCLWNFSCITSKSMKTWHPKSSSILYLR